MRKVLIIVLLLVTHFITSPHKAQKDDPYSTLVVLGAAQYHGRPSQAFKARLDHAFEIYTNNRKYIKKIIISGGKKTNDYFSEGEAGKKYLKNLGIPENILEAESKSKNTWQNLKFTAEILEKNEKITIITDEKHAVRASLVAKKLNLIANTNPTDKWQGDFNYTLREKIAYFLLKFFDFTGSQL